MFFKAYLSLLNKQAYRFIIEIGILRNLILSAMFLLPCLLFVNNLTHKNASTLYFDFFTGNQISLILILYSFIALHNSQYSLMEFTSSITNKNNVFVIKLLNYGTLLFLWVFIFLFPYANLEILFCLLIVFVISLFIPKIPPVKLKTIRLLSTPLLEINRFVRNTWDVILVCLCYMIIYKGLQVENNGLVLVFEFVIVLFFIALFSCHQEPMYYIMQYNERFKHFFLQKTLTIYKYTSLFFLPILTLLIIFKVSFFLFLPVLCFYLFFPFLLIIKYATYPSNISNILFQNLYVGFTIYSFSIFYLIPFWALITVLMVQKANKNFNTLFCATD